ncbi:TfoX/Sxy family protein [Nocardioides sp. CBS4Y-1]|uniref:TfoX/Sxy family protein n=2 Tax=Nocardioides acrostichi TaxID=2784339 RepID=A0A930UXD4_9ACTN|nr:TfoX/Sxy family protein [Nocardioides acrostichi]
MAYDETLAGRAREVLREIAAGLGGGEVAEKRMFGGLAFMVDGSMALTVGADGLLVRRPVGDDSVLAEPGASPAVMGARTMRGWVRVEAAVLASDDDLERWVRRGVTQALAAR